MSMCAPRAPGRFKLLWTGVTNGQNPQLSAGHMHVLPNPFFVFFFFFLKGETRDQAKPNQTKPNQNRAASTVATCDETKSKSFETISS